MPRRRTRANAPSSQRAARRPSTARVATARSPGGRGRRRDAADAAARPGGRRRSRACARSAARTPSGAQDATAGGQQVRQVVLEPPGAPRRPVPVGRRIEDEPVVAASAPGLALHEGPRRRRRSSGSGASARPEQLGVAARPGHGRARRVDVRDRAHRPAPGRASPGRCRRTGAGRRRGRRPSSRAATGRSHGSVATCSGKSPTWPASVGRSSQRQRRRPRPATARRAAPAPLQPRSRSKRRSAVAPARPGRPRRRARPDAGRSTTRSPNRSRRAAAADVDQVVRRPSGMRADDDAPRARGMMRVAAGAVDPAGTAPSRDLEHP